MEIDMKNQENKEKVAEHITLSDLLPLILEVTRAGKSFRLFPMGESMRPLLREGKDSVILVYVAPDDIRVGDMILYRRENGAFVLHRVIKEEKTGTLSMRGDAQYYNEEGVMRAWAIARVAGFYRGSAYHDCERSRYYRFYLFFRRLSYPLRRFAFRSLSFLRRKLKKR